MTDMNHRKYKLDSAGGFTVVELVVVIVVMAILTAVALVRFSGSTSGAISSAAHSILSDVSYAQELAKIKNAGTEVTFISSVQLPPPRWCFIATACYGAEAAPVAVLRQFRDQVLTKIPVGRGFISWYYQQGPGIAELVENSSLLKLMTRAVLLPLAVAAMPFVDEAWALGGGGGGGQQEGTPNTYSLKFQSGTLIKNPENGQDFVVYLGEQVTLTSVSRTIQFDGSGRMKVSGYNWSSAQTFLEVATLNNVVHIYIARHSGKMWTVYD